jgi:MFS superfamily sulfate permease-like transporter
MKTKNSTIRRATRAGAIFTGSALAGDLIAGLTLAAIAVPEQMATARLGYLSPGMGFLAFIAGTIGFTLFGASRFVSVGADSTITPIFAASLALIATAGSPSYAALAMMLAIMVGVLVGAAGICRMGWVSNLLSAPVTAGFLAGISVHIIASQLPVLCGISIGAGEVIARLTQLATALGRSNPWSVLIGAGVLVATAAAEKFDRRWPGALIGVVVATLFTILFSLEQRGVQVLGAVSPPALQLPHSWPTTGEISRLLPLSFLLAIVVMVQSAATTRSFPPDPDSPPDIARDFIGVGFGGVLAGLAGAFPVNASPPRTAIAAEAGARSKATGLFAAIAVGLLAAFGSNLLSHIPSAALAGVLLFVALRIVQLRLMVTVWRESKGEFALIITTALAIVVLPIETGVAAGVLLSLAHGMWTATRAKVIVLTRVPGTSVWWPPVRNEPAPESGGVLVLAFQAPLSFLNAEAFRRGIMDALSRAPKPVKLVVLEASSIVEIDFTAAQAMCAVANVCRAGGMMFAIARLESLRAQQSFTRFGIVDLVGSSHIYHSVHDAVEALAPGE